MAAWPPDHMATWPADGAAAIANALRSNTTITELSLGELGLACKLSTEEGTVPPSLGYAVEARQIALPPQSAGEYRDTSSIASRKISPTRFEPSGLFMLYFTIYSSTAQRFRTGRQSMFPSLSSKTRGSKLHTNSSFRGNCALTSP